MTDSIFSSASVESISNTTPIECVIQHLKFVRRYTLSLIDDLDDEEWFDQPLAGVTHIAWQVGHIAMSQYGLTLFRQRGRAEIDLQLMSGAFRKKFSKGTTPSANPDDYPSPREIREILNRVHQQMLVELPGFELNSLDQAIEPPHAGFATRYGALLFASDHEMLHAGQIGLIRRLIGKQPLR